MNINGLELPAELSADLAVGGRQLTDSAVERFRALLQHIESPLPVLYSNCEDIVRENQFWTTDTAQYYLGESNDEFCPGDVDPTLTLVIGDAEPDSPLALDYRTMPPRVVYLGDINHSPCWIEIASDYKSFIEMLEGKVVEYDG